MKNKFLPIGTVVLLEGGTKEVMITSYLITPKGTEKSIYDYGGCTFPEGVIKSEYAVGFNHGQIKEIVHMGHTNEAQKKLNTILNETCEEIKEKYLKGELENIQ